MAAAAKRLAKEKAMIETLELSFFQNLEVDPKNLLLWKALLVPDDPPYNEGAFWIEFSFPKEYPHKPPKVSFKTPIYHPNVDEDGQMCLPIISREYWKPFTQMDKVIHELIRLVNNPDPGYPLRADLAREFTDDLETFLSKAKAHACEFSEKRPCT